jgi:hypothetical protein
MVFCSEHSWHVDTREPWEPEAIPTRDRALERIKQRMQPRWRDRHKAILRAATVTQHARKRRKSATQEVAQALQVAQRTADNLIREARDAGYLEECDTARSHS